MNKVETGLTSFGTSVERVVCGTLDGVGRIFERATNALSLVAIPLCDGVVSYVAAQVIAESLHFPVILAYGAGFAMEGAGVLAARVPLEQHRFNQEQDKQKAPELLGWVTFAVQAGFSSVLIVLNAAGPEVRLLGIPWLNLPTFGMMTLSVQSLTATVAAGLYADIRQREKNRTKQLESERRERERVKAERREARKAAKLEQVQNVPERTPKQQAILQYVEEHPFATYEQIGEGVGLKKTATFNAVKELGLNKNGEGWKLD